MRWWAGLALAVGCGGSPPPREPPPIPSYEASEATGEVGEAVPELPDDCVLQVARPSDGWRLRIWEDGRVTEGRGQDAALDPYDATLGQAEARAAFVDRQRAAWTAALGSPVGGGPYVAAGSRRPGGTIAPVRLVFRVRGPEGVGEAVVVGDLRHAPSLGPLQGPWEGLRRHLWAPRR